MGQESSDRDLEMQPKLILAENDQISDSEDNEDYSFTLSDMPSPEPAKEMSSRIDVEDQAITFSFSTQSEEFAEFPTIGFSVSAPGPPGQNLWSFGQLSTSGQHDDVQSKQASTAAGAYTSRDGLNLFPAAALYNQPIAHLAGEPAADRDNLLGDKGRSSSSRSLPATGRSFHEQWRGSSSTGSQSSDLWGTSDRHSEKISCSSRSSSGNSENSHFSSKDPNRFRKRRSEAKMIQPISTIPSGDQLRNGKPYKAHDGTVSRDQAFRLPQKSSSHRGFGLTATHPAQLQAASRCQKNDNTTFLNWKLLSLQPLNPSHKRPDHEMQELRARRLSRSFRERSKSQGSSYNQGRYVWSLPATTVHTQPQSSRSSPSRQRADRRRSTAAVAAAPAATAAAKARGLEEKPRRGSQQVGKVEKGSYWRRSVKVVKSFGWFRDCKSGRKVAQPVDKKSLQDRNTRCSLMDRRHPEPSLLSPNKEARKVAITGAIAHCKSTHRKGWASLI